MADSVVKIDSELERKISELIKKNKFVFSSKKQVVNLAIIEFLKLQKFEISDSYQKQKFLKSRNLNKVKKKRKR